LPVTTQGGEMDQLPTLDEIKSWPATVSVADAARALGISRSQFYDLVRNGDEPVKILKLGSMRVVTSSLIRLLEDYDN
jgi:predicted DNA-binding transcriptional regulator AlpA